MQKINNLLNKNIYIEKKKTNNRHLKHEWMAFAYKTWKNFSGNKKDLPNVMRHFKLYHKEHRRLLDRSYSFCSDYMGPIPKLKLFYWKFWKLYKEGKSLRAKGRASVVH